MLTRQEAKKFYDRIGSRQDSQGFYEDAPVRRLVEHSDFESAGTVLEFGSGTGRFALDLLEKHLPKDAIYLGVELSPRMANLTASRLKDYRDRARVLLSDGSPTLPAKDSCADRVVSNYVLDLLSEADIELFFNDALRVLRPQGRLCLTGLTWGDKGLSRLTSGIWSFVHSLRPALVGGCRPMDVRDLLPGGNWRILHCETVVAATVPSQVLVASPR